jgi:ribosome-binding factor A
MSRRSDRAQKVGDQIQRELAALLRRKLRDPRVGRVTLTGVEMSPDCAHATVYFTCLDPAQVPQAQAGLEHAAGFLRTQLGQHIRLQRMPALRFVYDASVEHGDRLARLLRHVRTHE